jgi:hypothetical protein
VRVSLRDGELAVEIEAPEAVTAGA